MAEYLCPHLQSVAFNQASAVSCELGNMEQLSLAPGVSEPLAMQLRHVVLEAENQGVKLLMEVPGLPHTSTRMKWFSVFSGTRQNHWWCKFGRTVVSSALFDTVNCGTNLQVENNHCLSPVAVYCSDNYPVRDYHCHPKYCPLLLPESPIGC